jgi:hypothetical protein
MDPTVVEYDRTTYTLLELFGDVGGLHDFFVLLFAPLISAFASNRVLAILGEKLYSTSQPIVEDGDQKDKKDTKVPKK